MNLIPTTEEEIRKHFPEALELHKSNNWDDNVWIVHTSEEEEMYDKGIDGVQWDGFFLTKKENYEKDNIKLESDYYMGPGSYMSEDSILREVGPFMIRQGKVILED
jgi:hypothetical protein